VADLHGAVADAAPAAVAAAQRAPGHKVVALETATHHHLAEVVVLPDGRGYVVRSSLALLPKEATYQLWVVVNGRTISVGVLGRVPHLSTFTLADPPRSFELGVTVEPAGGSLRPGGPMLAEGTLAAAA
jgi:anti-sigma-K factor RskA